jgi:WD40 repeat protein/mono/diheme cytochrome c family protein
MQRFWRPPQRMQAAMILAVALVAVVPAARGDEPGKKVAAPSGLVSFYSQVLPILQRKCQGCHQPAKANGKLDMTGFAPLKKGGTAGAGFVPHKPEESPLVENVVGKTPAMPPNAPPLSVDEIATISRWVIEGGKDDTPTRARDTIDADHPPAYAAPPLITALAFAPDGKTLAVSGYREVLVHKADGSGLVARLVGQAQRVEGLTFAPDGLTLACVGGSPGRFGEVQFWDAKTYKLRLAVRSTFDTLYGGAFTPDGTRFAFGCADNSARVIDVKSGKETLRIDHHSDWAFGTAYSRDGKHLITLGREGALKLTEAATGSFVDDIGKNYGELKVLARHPKEDTVAIGGDEKIPRLYKIFRTQRRDMNYTDFNLIRAFETQPGPISAIAFSPDGSTLAVAGYGGEARLYNVANRARKGTLPGHNGGIFALVFSPDGSRIATGGFDGRVRLFDRATGKLAASFVPVPLSGVATATMGL